MFDMEDVLRIAFHGLIVIAALFPILRRYKDKDYQPRPDRWEIIFDDDHYKDAVFVKFGTYMTNMYLKDALKLPGVVDRRRER